MRKLLEKHPTKGLSFFPLLQLIFTFLLIMFSDSQCRDKVGDSTEMIVVEDHEIFMSRGTLMNL